ncbi:MAG: AAA family ATPase [Planctomycetaceae bacterium]|nr:AAA family ATPase [Planctomycetaceae bacterium]
MSEDLALLIRAGYPVISIETTDEGGAEKLVRSACESLNRSLSFWSLTDGLRPSFAPAESKPVVAPGKLAPALEYLREHSGGDVCLLKDAGSHTRDAVIHRLFRDLIAKATKTGSTLVLVDSRPLPDEFRPFAVRHELGWPDADELKDIIKDTFRAARARSETPLKASLTGRDFEQIAQALRGLSRDDAVRVVNTAIFQDDALTSDDLPRIVEAKRRLLGGIGCLEAIAADFCADDIGGLANLKSWLKRRRGGFSSKAAEFGLESPRGVLMLGIPGCGKSLCAKVVAADWEMPLLRLDPGVLYQSYIGASEGRLREALRQAEATAPCILWIDEIEKAFASASSDSADGGLSQRMFGTLLSWMQDHRHPIFLIATANDVSALPPELMRKGRFDEVFFVDLPTPASRRQVIAVHLRRRRRDPAKFDTAGLAEASEGFTGSELEQMVISGLFAAFEEKTELTDDHLYAALQSTRPLSSLMAERISDLRDWAADRCVSAD